jgi:hypothetical protein
MGRPYERTGRFNFGSLLLQLLRSSGVLFTASRNLVCCTGCRAISASAWLMRDARPRGNHPFKHYLREIQAFPESYNNPHRPNALWLLRTNTIVSTGLSASMRARP